MVSDAVAGLGQRQLRTFCKPNQRWYINFLTTDRMPEMSEVKSLLEGSKLHN